MHKTDSLPDNTPVIVAAAQCVEHVTTVAEDTLSSPMDMAAAACRSALDDAGVDAGSVDTIAMIRLFADAAKAWASPFGGSNNAPESVARRLGASPRERIYSCAGGTEPLTVMMELMRDIARGDKQVALLCGAEAIANQRAAMKQGITLDWSEEYDAPLDDRQYLKRFVSDEEIGSGLGLPAHYYALIENALAQRMGHSPAGHSDHMARMFAPFSQIAADNPLAQFPIAYSEEELAQESAANYLISLPYTKRLVAQDAVNQSAALLLTSAGHARRLGIAPGKWIVVDAYAQAEDQPLTQRLDLTASAAMDAVIASVLAQADCAGTDFDHIDIYSCFPCAVQAACESLALPTDGSVPLTVTGGLPFFGGPGNNYSMHAVAEMVARLRGTQQRALVTANGGILSKHAAAVLRAADTCEQPVDWAGADIVALEQEAIPTVAYAQDPRGGTVTSYTVIAKRGKPDIGIVLAETASGERFLASSVDTGITGNMKAASPVGRQVSVIAGGERRLLEFATP